MATVAENLQTIIDSKAAIKAAIEAKGVAVGDAHLTQYAGKIEEIQQGGGDVVEEAVENDVNFYDYTGFRVASYSIEEAKALTQEQYDAILPPTHEGLTFQEWNWTLEDIQTYDRQYADIGANYTPNDSKCHVKVSIPVDDFTFIQSFGGVNTTPTWIDWGDGIVETASFTSSHQYQNSGDYDITIYPKTSSETTNIQLTFSTAGNTTQSSLGFIKEINLAGWLNRCTLAGVSSKISIPASAMVISGFCNNGVIQINVPRLSQGDTEAIALASSLCNISFPKFLQNLSISNILNCSMTKLVLPQNTNAASYKYFQGAFALKIISLPTNVNYTGTSFLSGSAALQKIDIPQGWIPPANMSLNGGSYFIKESIVSFFNKLGTTTNTITLTFGATNLSKLTEEEKAIATNKGYTLA